MQGEGRAFADGKIMRDGHDAVGRLPGGDNSAERLDSHSESADRPHPDREPARSHHSEGEAAERQDAHCHSTEADRSDRQRAKREDPADGVVARREPCLDPFRLPARMAADANMIQGKAEENQFAAALVLRKRPFAGRRRALAVAPPRASCRWSMLRCRLHAQTIPPIMKSGIDDDESNDCSGKQRRMPLKQIFATRILQRQNQPPPPATVP